MPGPPPKPTAVKKLEGNPGKRKLPKEPELTALHLSDLPAFFPPFAHAFWREKVPLLRREVKLAAIDEPLAMSCALAFGLMMQAAQKLKREGLTIKEGDGARKKNPAAQVVRDQMTSFHTMASKLGMSPADRARLFSDLLAGEKEGLDTDDVLNGSWKPEPLPGAKPN